MPEDVIPESDWAGVPCHLPSSAEPEVWGHGTLSRQLTPMGTLAFRARLGYWLHDGWIRVSSGLATQATLPRPLPQPLPRGPCTAWTCSALLPHSLHSSVAPPPAPRLQAGSAWPCSWPSLQPFQLSTVNSGASLDAQLYIVSTCSPFPSRNSLDNCTWAKRCGACLTGTRAGTTGMRELESTCG